MNEPSAMPPMDPISLPRRRFLMICAAGALASLVLPRSGFALTRARSGPHPEPRPGIDASKVLTAEQLRDAPEALPAFDAVRKIPGIADGIRCHCGCADRPEHYSLLSCFEGEGMARMCLICQGEGTLAEQLHRQGRNLDQIRTAIDARFA